MSSKSKKLTADEQNLIIVLLQRVISNLENSKLSEPGNNIYMTDESLLVSCDLDTLNTVKSALAKLNS